MSGLHDLLASCTAVSVNTVSGRENVPPDDGGRAYDRAQSGHGRLVGAHVRKPPVACLERQDSLGINRGGIAARQADTMRNFKKDQLVQKADEELSEVVPDNLKVKCIPAARQS